ncbi:hypothetical protein [Salisediminibacterium selenitireducens]|uniref:Uncharacterized protein n=1 Tax=Bacillus selenitireducens (strain ATCC 700615 / DSM 15326 / MLS10) TaxID=439292 RepID=D6XSQ3_BACIE|nr:hypothetical protein [Salisediminibacterium selenitireducens]ADH98839.1 hypothetical protein Bsel_1327 [[Bacillus] selenitireducens MLS10]
MNKERWVVAGVAVVAVSIWGVLLFTIFSTPDEPEMADDPISENGDGLADMYEDALEEDDTFPSPPDDIPESSDPDPAEEEASPGDGNAPTEEPVQEDAEDTDESVDRRASMRTRGIHPGDFQDIAPDGIASIDDVLERLEEE